MSRASSDTSAPGTTRTSDLCLRRAALYPLSYGRMSREDTGVSTAGGQYGRTAPA